MVCKQHSKIIIGNHWRFWVRKDPHCAIHLQICVKMFNDGIQQYAQMADDIGPVFVLSAMAASCFGIRGKELFSYDGLS